MNINFVENRVVGILFSYDCESDSYTQFLIQKMNGNNNKLNKIPHTFFWKTMIDCACIVLYYLVY